MNQASHSAPICKKCGAEKSWRLPRKHRNNGFWTCKACKAQKDRESQLNNPERVKANKARFEEKNPGYMKKYRQQYYAANCEKIKAKSLAWHHANRERASEQHARWRSNPDNAEAARQRSNEWYEQNPEAGKERSRRWGKANPLKKGGYEHKRRALKLSSIDADRPVTVEVQIERKALFDGCCFCGSQEKLTLEHVIPLSKGGPHVPENLLGSCFSCNTRKRAQPVEEWFRKQPFFSEERWSAIKRCTDLDCA